jgi:hypothetical protein
MFQQGCEDTLSLQAVNLCPSSGRFFPHDEEDASVVSLLLPGMMDEQSERFCPGVCLDCSTFFVFDEITDLNGCLRAGHDLRSVLPQPFSSVSPFDQ